MPFLGSIQVNRSTAYLAEKMRLERTETLVLWAYDAWSFDIYGDLNFLSTQNLDEIFLCNIFNIYPNVATNRSTETLKIFTHECYDMWCTSGNDQFLCFVVLPYLNDLDRNYSLMKGCSQQRLEFTEVRNSLTLTLQIQLMWFPSK